MEKKSVEQRLRKEADDARKETRGKEKIIIDLKKSEAKTKQKLSKLAMENDRNSKALKRKAEEALLVRSLVVPLVPYALCLPVAHSRRCVPCIYCHQASKRLREMERNNMRHIFKRHQILRPKTANCASGKLKELVDEIVVVGEGSKTV